MTTLDQYTVYGWLLTRPGKDRMAVLLSYGWCVVLVQLPGGGWIEPNGPKNDPVTRGMSASDWALARAARLTDFYVDRGYTVASPEPEVFTIPPVAESVRFRFTLDGWVAHLAMSGRLR